MVVKIRPYRLLEDEYNSRILNFEKHILRQGRIYMKG